MFGALRTSPSGQFVPIMRMSLSAPHAFSDGVLLPIPFDRIDYTKGDIGVFFSPPSGGLISLAVAPGVYFVQLQVTVSASVALELQAGIEDVTRTEAALVKTAASVSGAVSVNAVIPRTDTPVSASIFAGLIATMKGTGAGGNVNTAELLIVQVGGFE
jgi:hypothetical protein